MNIDRLRTNIPVLIKVIRSEYNLSYQHIAMVFNVNPQLVVEWEFDKNKPNEEIISAMIIAYRWVKFWTPVKLFVRLLRLTYLRAYTEISTRIRKFVNSKILHKPEQIGLDF